MKYLRKLGSMMAGMKARLVIFGVFFLVRPAFAFKLSTFAANWKSEFGALVPVILLGIAAVGICTAGTAIISGVMAKKNQRPLEWQAYGLFGGGLATVIPIIILAFAGSTTDENGGAEGVMSDLNLKY